MAETLEEAYLEWLDRFEQKVGFTKLDDALEEFEKAYDLYLDETGYTLNVAQYDALRSASTTRYELLPEVGVTYTLRETKAGWYAQYKYVPTGQFISGEAAFGLLGFEYP